jgi:hypothetical protein
VRPVGKGRKGMRVGRAVEAMGEGGSSGGL